MPYTKQLKIIWKKINKFGDKMNNKKCKCPYCDSEIKESNLPFCTPCDVEINEKIDESLDCIGLYCPAPVFETRKKIDSMEKGQVLEMVADDPASEEDIKAWSKRTGNELLQVDKIENNFRFLIRKK
jgi:tRNA 2-thiouridine synthesizing protein A